MAGFQTVSPVVHGSPPAYRRLQTGVLALLMTLAPAAAFAQAFNLGVRIDQPMLANPTAISTADLNGDGNPDLVTTSQGTDLIAVRIGDGTGNFGTMASFTTGLNPYGLALVDLNNDGRLDAVTTNIGANTISVLLGNGAGGFGPKTDFPAGITPFWVAPGDLNDDGRQDLAVANNGSDNVSVFLGNGSGGFAPRVDYPTGGASYPVSIAIGELNGDGKSDVAVATSGPSTITRFLGNGDGTLGSMTTYPTAMSPFSVAIGDVNHDGRADLAVATFNGAAVSVLLASGAPGNFGPKTDYATTGQSQSVVISDLDGDKNPDLAVTGVLGSAVTVWKGDGLGGFASRSDIGVGSYPVAVAAEDVNGDGLRDLLSANFGDASVSLLLAGGGLYGAKTDYPTGAGCYSVAIDDLNDDARPDLAVVSDGTSRASVLLNTGAGAFGPKTDYVTGLEPRGVALGDVSGDGLPDIVTASWSSIAASVLLNTGGGFGPRTDYPTALSPISVALADLNADGRLDVAVANHNGNSVSVLMGTGGGSFAAKVDYPTGTNPTSVAIGDLNGDGRPDLVTSNALVAGTVSVLLATLPLGTFGTKTDYAVGLIPQTVEIGDVNRDGSPDLVAGNNADVSVLLGTGGGAFGPKTDFATGSGARARIGDVSGDGRPDLVVAHGNTNTFSVLLGNGYGSFGPRTDYTTGLYPSSVAIADLNSDGRLDVATSNYGAASASVMLAVTPTRIALAPMAPAVLGAPITLTATVTAVTLGAPTPTGTVRFYDGTTFLGASPVNAGVAGLALFAPHLGNRTITAEYKGTNTFSGSYSSARTLRVVPTAAPLLTSIKDVKNDQGRLVRLKFDASPYDVLGSGTPIVQYLIYRRIQPGFVANGVRTAAQNVGEPLENEPLLAGWDHITTLPATADGPYETVATTLADSNSTGFHRATFMVRAATATIGVHFDSPPDSGHSVDNLPPAPPLFLVGAYAAGATHLHWSASGEDDFWHYRIYRGTSAGFVPGPGNLIAAPPDTGYADSGPAGRYYKLSTVDWNGNESGYVLLTPSGTVDAPDAASFAFTLEGARPNPSRGHRLTIAFTLPSAASARLELLDVGGRRVAMRDVGSLGAGRHVVDVAPERRLAPGVYLVRLMQAGRSATGRVMVTD